MALTYHASPIESAWFNAGPPDGVAWVSVGGKICAIAERRSQVNATRPWLTFADTHRGPVPRGPDEQEHGVLSRFVGRDGCAEYIEPLTGLARHPLSRGLGCKRRFADAFSTSKWKVDKYAIGHLIAANHCGGKASGGGNCGRDVGPHGRCRISAMRGGQSSCARNLFFDLGCSVYGKPPRAQSAAHASRGPPLVGSGLGSSLQLFSALYAHNCIEFDRMYVHARSAASRVRASVSLLLLVLVTPYTRD